TSIVDPEGFETTYTWDSAGRVLTRSVAGNLGQYTYQLDANGILTMTYADPLGNSWTHVTSGNGNPVRRIDPAGNRESYTYLNFRPQTFQNAPGNQTSFSFDGNGFMRVVKDPLG